MKITDFIISEDIRTETGNKISIMGIYNEEVRLNLPDDIQWPVPYRFGVYIRLEIEDSDAFPNRFVLKVDHNNNTIAQIDGNIEFKASMHSVTLPFVIQPFPLPGLGILRFNFEIYKDENLLRYGIHEIKVLSQNS
ncbi:MAG: hypothetical protein WAW61_20120 [Methylococcaceae bacterium]